MVFWVVTPLRRVGGYERFGGTYRLHRQDDMFTVARTSKHRTKYMNQNHSNSRTEVVKSIQRRKLTR